MKKNLLIISIFVLTCFQFVSAQSGNILTLPGGNSRTKSNLIIPPLTSKISHYPFTVEMWVKPTSWVPYGGFWMSRTSSRGTATGLYFDGIADGRLRFDLEGVSRAIDLSSCLPALNEWHHIAVVVKSDSIMVIMDQSVYKTARTNTWNQAFKYLTYIGWDPATNDRTVAGQFDEIRFWNIARTKSQIFGYEHKVLTGSEPGLVAYYNFNNNTANDLTSNGFNGIINGGSIDKFVINKHYLSKGISDAKYLISHTTVGSNKGEYSQSIRSSLEKELSKAQKVFNNAVAKQISIDRNTTDLNNQIQKYISSCNVGDNAPSNLMVEGIRDPMYNTIQNPTPHYSWILPQNSLKQKGYQILVSSSISNILNNVGDVWDSHKVSSDQSTNVLHLGHRLLQDSTYYWKVRFINQKGNFSNYSRMQIIKTGNLSGNLTQGFHFQKEYIQPALFRKKGNNRYFIDFGKDAFGTLVLRCNSPKKDTLTIRLGEKAEADSIDRNPGGNIRYCQFTQVVDSGDKSYQIALHTSSGHGTGMLPYDTLVVVTPFRYCEIDNCKGALTADDVFQKAYFDYNQDSLSHFTSSDPILDSVWNLCKYSIKATSFTGYYIDGDRERLPYEADAYINQLGNYNIDREYAMARRTFEWFMKKPTWPTEWSLHIPMIAKADYDYTGNLELIKKYYNKMKLASLIDLARADGLIGLNSPNYTRSFRAKLGVSLRDIVDWPSGERDGYDMTPAINTVVNCFFYHDMKIMAEFADVLGKEKDKAMFLSMAQKVKNSINTELYNKETGLYIDGEGSTHSSLHANMFPLAFGIVPENRQKAVVSFIKSRGMRCSVYGAQYLLDALYKAGEGQYALNLIRSTGKRSWYNMIRVGSTITLEAWDMKYKPNLDWNHAWGTAPANIIPRLMWGIQPKTPAFGTILIHPQLGDLTSTSITVPTIKGEVKCSYLQNGPKGRTYQVELPANSTGEFINSVSSNTIVILNGKTSRAKDILILKPGKNTIIDINKATKK